jgi:hypothetical protein
MQKKWTPFRKEIAGDINNDKNLTLINLLYLSSAFFLFSGTCVAQYANNQSSDAISWVIQADPYIKLIGGAIGILAAILGIPIYILNFYKTKAELKRLHLENQEKEEELARKKIEFDKILGYNGKNSPLFNLIDITDPRIVIPIFLVLNYIIAFIIQLIANHGQKLIGTSLLSVFGTNFLSNENNAFLLALSMDILQTAISIILFFPIIKEGKLAKREYDIGIIPGISILLSFIIAFSILNIVNNLVTLFSTIAIILLVNYKLTSYVLVLSAIGLILSAIIGLYLLLPILKDAYIARDSIRGTKAK